jgi:tellurite resistance protein TehA-like permease
VEWGAIRGPDRRTDGSAGTRRPWTTAWVELVADLPPGAFAVVMATGIISVVAHDEQARAHVLSTLSGVLAWLAAAVYGVLVALNLARLVGVPERLRRDLSAPPASFESLTFAAASGVLAVRALLAGHRTAATVLGLAAAAGWLGLGAAAAAGLARRPPGRLRRVVRGSWLLAVVAGESVAVLAAISAGAAGAASPSPSAGPGGEGMAMLLAAAASCWLAGVVLYGLLAACIWPRLLAALRGSGRAWFGPDDWIAMGGLAIAALAASQIALAARPVHGGMATAAAGLAAAAWVAASALLAPLAALQLRSLTRAPAPAARVGAGHSLAARWAAVFPVGMYAAASHALAAVLRLAALETAAWVFLWIALGAWLATAAGVAGACLAARSRR